MENLKSGFEFIFSSYKRTAAILFIAALTLAIPITITLVGQRQDIRQRAEEPKNEPTTTQGTISEETLRSFCNDCLSDDEEFACGQIRDGRLRVECEDENNSEFGLCISCKNLPTPTCTPRPACLDTEPRCLMPAPTGGWCLTTNTPTPIPTSAGFCGDGTCQNAACLGLQCPEPENTTNCPQDCNPPVDDHCLVPPGTPLPSDCPQPSQTPIPTLTGILPATTSLSISIALTGIGVSQNPALGINNNPKRPARNIDIKFFNSQNQEVLSRNAATQFDPTSGLYKGTIVLGANFQGGPYIIKVRMDNTLWEQAVGIQNIVAGQNNSISQPLSLVTGDTNQDNEINLFDYTIFLTCYRGNCEGFPTVKIDMENLMYAFNVKKKYE